MRLFLAYLASGVIVYAILLFLWRKEAPINRQDRIGALLIASLGFIGLLSLILNCFWAFRESLLDKERK